MPRRSRAFAGTRLYLAGIGIANEGVDWVLTIDDLSEGHWVAAVAFLPFVAHAAVPGAKLVIKKADGTPVAQFTKAGAELTVEALKKLTFAERWTALQAADLPLAARQALVKTKHLDTGPSSRLRSRFEPLHPIPDTIRKPQYHHELPVKFRDDFAAYGFDYNDPQFGKWVEAGPHGRWSYDWNKRWLDPQNIENPNAVINRLRSSELSLEEGRTLIMQTLNELRAGYGPTGAFPDRLPSP